MWCRMCLEVLFESNLMSSLFASGVEMWSNAYFILQRKTNLQILYVIMQSIQNTEGRTQLGWEGIIMFLYHQRGFESLKPLLYYFYTVFFFCHLTIKLSNRSRVLQRIVRLCYVVIVWGCPSLMTRMTRSPCTLDMFTGWNWTAWSWALQRGMTKSGCSFLLEMEIMSLKSKITLLSYLLLLCQAVAGFYQQYEVWCGVYYQPVPLEAAASCSGFGSKTSAWRGAVPIRCCSSCSLYA